MLEAGMFATSQCSHSATLGFFLERLSGSENNFRNVERIANFYFILIFYF